MMLMTPKLIMSASTSEAKILGLKYYKFRADPGLYNITMYLRLYTILGLAFDSWILMMWKIARLLIKARTSQAKIIGIKCLKNPS